MCEWANHFQDWLLIESSRSGLADSRTSANIRPKVCEMHMYVKVNIIIICTFCANMESISRISSMLDTGMIHLPFPTKTPYLNTTAARELTVEAAQIAGSARTVNSRPSHRDLPFAQVKKLLDSRNDREILEGLRKVIDVCKIATLTQGSTNSMRSRFTVPSHVYRTFLLLLRMLRVQMSRSRSLCIFIYYIMPNLSQI